jgi:aryl-alcohol dehydrogenase-like predicted oxidoreductase
MTSSTNEVFEATHLVGGQDRVPRLGYGAMQLAGPGVIGLPDDVTGAIEILRQAVDRGVRFFDTANAYGPRTVNQLIGRALSPFADDVVIGNKVGAWRGAAGEWLTDSRPETVRTQVEDALLDMRTESSALTYLRLWGDSQAPANTPAEEVPLEESLGALIELREEGKIRHIGLSGASPEMLERAQQMTTIAAVQNRFNLIDRSGIEVLAACERDRIAFVPYFPLATGALGEPDALTRPAQRLDVPTSTVALAWLLRRSPVIIPIPGTKSSEHLADNVRASEIAPHLTDEEIRVLTAVEDEDSATLNTMSTQMVDALTRRRLASV